MAQCAAKQELLIEGKNEAAGREWRAVFSCLAVTLAALTQGTMYVWNSFALPQIEEEFCGGNCTNSTGSQVGQVSLLASASYIGAGVGAVLSGWAVSVLPHSRLIPGLAVVTGLSWVCLLAAPLPALMVAGKLVLGLAVSLQCSAVPLYISIVAPPARRGLLLSLYSIVRNLGQVLVTAVSVLTPLPWRVLTAVFGLVPAGLLLLLGPLLIQPEHGGRSSARENRVDVEGMVYGMLNCTSVTMWVRDWGRNIENPRIGRLLTVVRKTSETVGELGNIIEKKKELEKNYGSSKISTLSNKGVAITKATLYIVFLSCSSILSGVVVIINFPSKLITSDYPYNAVTVLSISLGVKLLGSIVSSFVTLRFGMKLPLLLSSMVMAVSMFVFSAYYGLSLCSAGSAWCFLPAVNIVIFYFAFAIGIGSLLPTIIGERLPLRQRILTMPAILVSQEAVTAAQNGLVPLLLDQFNNFALVPLFTVFGLSNTVAFIVAAAWLS